MTAAASRLRRLVRSLEPDADVLEIVQEWAASGDSFDINERGQTPLVIAAGRGLEKSVVAMLAAGADPRYTAPRGATALHVCAQDPPTIMRRLLEAGADVHARDPLNFNETPLHAAALQGKADACEVLLQHGADVTALQSGGLTPFEYALRSQFRIRRVATVLLRAGATVPYLPKPTARFPKLMPVYVYVMRVNCAGSFQNFARKHIGKLGRVVAKCTGLPEDASYAVALFIADPGDPGKRTPPYACP